MSTGVADIIDVPALLAENEQLKAENEALRAETERLYRIVEDETWVEDLFAESNDIVPPMDKLGLWAYRKAWPTLPKNEFGLAETKAKDLAPLMGGNPDNILEALTRGAKLGIIKKPKPCVKPLFNEVTGKPILDKRGKQAYSSKLFTAPTETFDDVSSWKEHTPPELVRKHGGHHPKKPIPPCPICGEPATKEHATLHCGNGHTWEVTTNFTAESDGVKPQLANSLDDQELAALFDETYEAKCETATCPSKGDIEPQVAVSEPALEELQQFAQWVYWRFGSIDLATGKRKKIPYDVKTGRPCDYTNPASWSPYDAAKAALDASQSWKIPHSGLGFVFSDSDPFVGIDLDGCIENGIVSDQAQAIITALDSYAEKSPSRSGAHIIVKGDLPAALKTSGIEMYSTRRFFTFTGEQLPGTPAQIASRQAEIDALYQRIAPPPLPVIPAQACANIAADDMALLERALKDEKFARLMAGDTAEYNGDESRADLALVRKLAYYTGDDRKRIDGLFRQSSLMRPKWDEKRGVMTYGQLTIEKVVGRPTVHTKPPLWTTLAAAVMP